MAGKLEEYNQKRDFEKTAEPKGKTEKSDPRLRFVVQHHSARRDHFDLRLEWAGVMLSWAVPKGPSYNPRDKRLAVETEDHPLEYRDFEGTIPEGGYGGGVVMIWDEGSWEPQGDTDTGIKDGNLKIILYGKRLKGKWALIRMAGKPSESKKNWLLIKEKDEYILDNDGISEFATSVRTGRTMEEILHGKEEIHNEVKNPFRSVSVQLAKLADRVPEGADWLYEIKFDGYRIIAYIEGDKARLETRNGQDYTENLEDIAESLMEWADGRPMVLDGEVVMLDAEGKSDFQALQNYLKSPKEHSLVYMIFDLIAFQGSDLRRSRLIDRKNKLEALMKNAPQNIRYSSHINGNGKDFLRVACGANLEGIIGKKADSVYTGNRNGDWIKIKCGNEQEFIIGGYTLSAKKTSGVSSILLGVYEEDDLVYAGRAGTGFTAQTMNDLEDKFKKIVSTTPPFNNAPKPRTGETIIWLKPSMVAQIRFAEWTGDNVLRQASFKGLRNDKDPKDVKRENKSDNAETRTEHGEDQEEKRMEANRMSVTINGVSISSPDKVMYQDPAITKREVADYYSRVAERMLPYVSNRILSIIRCPKSISGECFYKKHPGPGSKGVIDIPVEGKDGETKNYFYIDNAFGLISEVQMGTLEFHTWGSRVSQLELPDMMVFDLDPGEGLGLGRIREGVRDLKRMLDELSLISYLKTSGGKGYHIVIPLQPSVGWDAFSEFAKRIAEVMEQRWPDRYTSNIRKEKRKGKIFIDWIRNSRGATSIAPYSLRARIGAPVSMPISWEELDTVAPDGGKLRNAIERVVQEDPWEDFFKIKQRIKGEKL